MSLQNFVSELADMVSETWHKDVLTFWFNELTPKQWYVSDAKVDEMIKNRFGELVAAFSENLPDGVKGDAEKCLATIICFDQFTRNIYRGDAKAFAQDHKALELAQYLHDKGWDRDMSAEYQQFAHMPFMHAEDMEMQEISLKLFSQKGEEATKAAKDHYAIIEKFGRYPHRNECLGRASTPEEVEYLKEAQRFGQ